MTIIRVPEKRHYFRYRVSNREWYRKPTINRQFAGKNSAQILVMESVLNSSALEPASRNNVYPRTTQNRRRHQCPAATSMHPCATRAWRPATSVCGERALDGGCLRLHIVLLAYDNFWQAVVGHAFVGDVVASWSNQLSAPHRCPRYLAQRAGDKRARETARERERLIPNCVSSCEALSVHVCVCVVGALDRRVFSEAASHGKTRTKNC